MYRVITGLFIFCLSCITIITQSNYFLEISVVFSSIALLYLSYKLHDKVSAIFLFSVSFFTYNCSRILLSLIAMSDWGSGFMFIDYDLSENVRTDVLMSLLLFLMFSILGVSLVSNDNKASLKNYPRDITLMRVAEYTMIFCLFPLLYRKFLELDMMSGHHYSEVYLKDGIGSVIPSYLRGFNLLFESAFYIFISNKPARNKFILYSFLYVFLGALTAINGGRTGLITSVFVIMTVYSYFYGLKLSFKLLIIGGVTVIFSQLISYDRSGEVGGGILKGFYDFFYEQGSSVNVIGFNLLYKDLFSTDSVYNLFSPLYDGFKYIIDSQMRNGQSLYVAMNSFSLAAQLSYAMNSDYYLKGFGVGSNFIAEVYNFLGNAGVSIIGFVIGYFGAKFERVMLSPILTYMTIPFLLNLYISPRGSLLPNILTVLTFAIAYLSIYSIRILIARKIKK